MKDAVQCGQELTSPSSSFIFVLHGIKLMLDYSTIACEHVGQLLHELLCSGHLSTAQYYQWLCETLEFSEDMEIDIPHMWLYLAELITSILQEDGVPMGLFSGRLRSP